MRLKAKVDLAKVIPRSFSPSSFNLSTEFHRRENGTTNRTMVLSESKVSHRTALALNNEAVVLIKQGLFLAAKHTFSQSLLLLEHVHLQLLDEGYTGECHVRGTAGSYSKDFHEGQRMSSTANPDGSPADNFEIHVLEDCDVPAIRSACRYGLTSSVFFPVILRDGDDAEADSDTLSKHHAIVLYNRALACVLAHFQHQNDDPRVVFSGLDNKQQALDKCRDHHKSSKLLRAARRSLDLSTSVLCTVGSEASRTASLSPIKRISLMVISELVYNFHSVVLRENGKPDLANMVLRTIQKLPIRFDQDDARQDAEIQVMFEGILHPPAA